MNPATGDQPFVFRERHYDPATGVATLSWSFGDSPPLVETLEFPYAPWPQDVGRQAAFLRALELLHAVAGVSYYKAVLPRSIDPGDLRLDEETARFLQNTWEQGLAEFAHVNELNLHGRIRFPVTHGLPPTSTELQLPQRALVAMGGGKDSLVSLEVLREAGVEVQPFAVGSSQLIADTVKAAGLPMIRISRKLAPQLKAMNEAGAWNGHVPVTAINSAIGACAALLYGFSWVVFSNERSASEPTLVDEEGRAVNHQYSKSLEFEEEFRSVVARRVSPDLEYFSLLRPWSELAIAHNFAGLRRYHEVFSSCNRNFHLDGSRNSGRWCGHCPKCRFTSLVLAPWLEPQELEAIMGSDLLNDVAQLDGYRALCGLGQDKPFECVGTVDESRACVLHLAQSGKGAGRAVIETLAPELEAFKVPDLDELMQADDLHCIPEGLRTRVDL